MCIRDSYLDASIHVQFSFVNRKTGPKQYAKSFEIKAQGDNFDDIRAEYSGILQDQLVRGNNGLTKRKMCIRDRRWDRCRSGTGQAGCPACAYTPHTGSFVPRP